MEDKISKFFQVLSKLSPEAQKYFDTPAANRFTKKFSQKYGLVEEMVDDMLIAVVAENFDFSEVEKTLTVVENINKQEAVIDFIGYIFGPIHSFLPSGIIEKALESRGSQLGRYQLEISEYRRLLEDEDLDKLSQFVEAFKKDFDLEGELAMAKELFKTSLLEIISDNIGEPINVLNQGLVYILINHESSRDELIKELLENNQVLSNKNFTFEGKSIVGTVELWFKDFFQKIGGGKFDNIKLTEFLTNSENGKLLDLGERRILGDIFKTYYNIKYFPESMAHLTPEKWHIIPMQNLIGENKGKLIEIKKIEASNPSPIVSAVTPVTPNEVSDIHPDNVENINSAKARITELQKMANTFPVGSLERRALEQEISSLNK